MMKSAIVSLMISFHFLVPHSSAFGQNWGPSMVISYAYQLAEPRDVNGEPNLAYKYWACVDSVEIQFEQPVRAVSLQGKVVARGKYRSERALTFERLNAEVNAFKFKVAGSGICDSHLSFEEIVLKAGVASTSGQKISREMVSRLRFPSPRSTMPPSPLKIAGDVPEALEVVELEDDQDEWGFDAKTLRQCPGGANKPCLTNLRPTGRLDPVSINQALHGLQQWEAVEKTRSMYRRERLSLLPTDGTIIEPRGSTNRARHYGMPDILLLVRKSAKFVEQLFADVETIGVADLTTPTGETPYMTWPDGSRQYLHPEGSHQGHDADIGYISIGGGNDRKKDIDLEASFWLLYSALQSSAVDIIYTAYKPQFQAYARDALRLGLINEIAVARIDSARLIQDTNLRHDTHFHIKATNHDNNRRSLRFQAADNTYNCMIGLRPNNSGSENNFCLSR